MIRPYKQRAVARRTTALFKDGRRKKEDGSLRRFFHRERLADLRDPEIADEAERVEALQRDPGDVEFVPGQAMTGRHRVRVMVVMPALAEREERDPPAVARVVARLE